MQKYMNRDITAFVSYTIHDCIVIVKTDQMFNKKLTFEINIFTFHICQFS